MAGMTKALSFRKKHEQKRDEGFKKASEGGTLLKKMAVDSAVGSRILIHNGIVFCIYAVAMFVIAYAALQAAFYFVAVIAGSTGAYLMATEADILTVYVILAVICGFDLFFAFKIENLVIKAMTGRFWHRDRNDNSKIDRGEVWRRKHPDESTESK